MKAEREHRIATIGYDYASQPKEQLDQCNYCHAIEFTVISHRDRYGYPVEAHMCHQCGLVFLNPRMTATAYAEFYRGVYRPLVSAFHGRLINAETIQEEQLVYARQLEQFLAPFVSPLQSGILLDIGGSTGVVARHLCQKFGLAGTVLDPSPAELARASALGLNVVPGFLESYDGESDRRFDLIVLCQTIDHLLDISSSICKIRELLSPRGLFFVDIVDFRAAYLRNKSVVAAIKVDHPYYLAESTMEAYLRRHGFRVLRKNYAADHLHIGYVCTHAEPDTEFLPNSGDVRAIQSEIRLIQIRGE